METLVIEVYEYAESMPPPHFAYLPCNLSLFRAMKNMPLREIIRKSFEDVSRGERNSENQNRIIQLLEDASIDRIKVTYHPATKNEFAYVELINVVPAGPSTHDVRRKGNDNSLIILKGRYVLSGGNQSTRLMDAQRLTLTYSGGTPEDGWDEESNSDEAKRDIVLNITFLQT